MHGMKNMSSVGLLWMWQWSSLMRKRRVMHSNLARHGVLFCETWCSHTRVDEDYALSTGEGLRTFRWNVVPSSWAVGPKDEGNLTSRQEEMSWTSLILTNTAVRISPPPPNGVPKCQQETTNWRCVESQKSATKHLWTNLNFDVRNKFSFMNVLVQLLYGIRQRFLTFFCAMDPSESLVKPTDPFSQKCI
jgi:hypothetical protein